MNNNKYNEELTIKAKQFLDDFVKKYAIMSNSNTEHLLLAGYHRYTAMVDMVECLGIMEHNEAKMYREQITDIFNNASDEE